MKSYNFLENHQLVVDKFGYWPDFHDAEIYRLTLDKLDRVKEGYTCATLEFTIHCWEMTSEVDSNGYYKLEKHHLILFRFEDIFEVELDGYNHQNAVLSIEFEILEKNEKGFTPLHIEIDPAWGLGGEFKALNAKIISVHQCDKNARQS